MDRALECDFAEHKAIKHEIFVLRQPLTTKITKENREERSLDIGDNDDTRSIKIVVTHELETRRRKVIQLGKRRKRKEGG